MAFNVVENTPDRVSIENVLVSVYDKSGLEKLVAGLLAASPRVQLYSTGGTYRRIEEILGGDDRLHAITDLTGRREMQGGLVKTLDFSIYLGLLAEPYNNAHEADIARTGAIRFDATVVNLYPFQQVISDSEVSLEAARGNIDIGGPTMIRASAKNFLRVAAICDPTDYDGVLSEMRENQGTIGLETRFRLARKAFAHTAEYDSAIARYLAATPAVDLPYNRR